MVKIRQPLHDQPITPLSLAIFPGKAKGKSENQKVGAVVMR